MEKKQNKIILAVIVLAIFLNLVSVSMIPFKQFSIVNLLYTPIVCIEHLFVIYYVLFGYKKPHGNTLRYVMLLFTLTLGIELVVFASEMSILDLALSVAKALVIPYIAGRLNKIEQNKILISVVFILFMIDAIYYCVIINPQTFFGFYSMFGEAIEWFAISAAYFVRYKEHKEAGLTDK